MTDNLNQYRDSYGNLDRRVVATIYQNLAKIVMLLEQACLAMPDQELVWAAINEMEGMAAVVELNEPIINSFTRAAASALDDMRLARGEVTDVSDVEAFLQEEAGKNDPPSKEA